MPGITKKKWVDDSDPHDALAEVMEGTPICGVCNDTGLKEDGSVCSPCKSAWMRKPACVACGGTGKNSKGGPCLPCEWREMREYLAKPIAIPDLPHDMFGE